MIKETRVTSMTCETFFEFNDQFNKDSIKLVLEAVEVK